VNRSVRVVLFVIPPILVLVVLPQLLIGFVPSSVSSESESALGFSIRGFVDDLAVFGILLAAFSALQTWAYKWSVVKPVASALHMLTSYTLLLFLLGFGNPLTFGTADIGINPSAFSGNTPGLGTLHISFVSTFLALLVGVAVVAKTAQKTMKYREDRQFHRMDLEAGKGQALAQPSAAAQSQTGSARPLAARLCPNCGKPVGDTAFCTNCGASLKPG